MIIRPSVAVAAAIMATTSGSTASARSEVTATISDPIKYCATVTINSRVSRKICLTEQEWLNHGFKWQYYLLSVLDFSAAYGEASEQYLYYGAAFQHADVSPRQPVNRISDFTLPSAIFANLHFGREV